MRVSADPVSVIPDDVQLVPVTACAAALGLSERKTKAVLSEERVPVVQLGARSAGVRLSDIRSLLKKRER